MLAPRTTTLKRKNACPDYPRLPDLTPRTTIHAQT
jgi:hypothetical protein